MSDTATTYQDLIKEAFIDPIRTVTVIDDEYPTLQELLQNSGNTPDTDNPNIARLINITKMCHENHKWSLDVFNGKSPKIDDDNYIPEHLHHSDLLILDYHLDGNQDDGKRARKIINKLDFNNHFNIVLVHTKGVADDNIKQVFEEILGDFYTVNGDIFSSLSEKKELIEEWLYENSDSYKWLDKENVYSIKEVVEFVSNGSLKKYKKPEHIFNSFSDEISAINESLPPVSNIGFSIGDLILFRLREVIAHCEMSIGAIRNDLVWKWEDNNLNYISTGKVFISVVHKSSDDPEEELYTALCDSLNHFNASPMHLLMAKIRHEIDERGLEQAQSILLNRSAQAGWLYSLLSNSKDTLAHDKAIDLHWEQLGRSSKSSLREFSIRLASVLLSEDKKVVIERFFKECIENVDLSCGHLNAFTCSMPVIGKHLNTGTVFSVNDEFWVCLTPACDLVPGQKSAPWKSRIGTHYLAFKAVKLNNAKLPRANEDANTNEFVYLNCELFSEPKAFAFTGGGSPIWDTFYASNQGLFTEEKKIGLAQVRENEGNLSIKKVEAQVVAELRYEYALNLLQRFGANQTRVGLDFIQKDNLW
ncbi:response regulator receiver domain [Marinomonas sp. RSW2]|uniref:Response regulator receiver domain n=1 Tax=Marinomonas maritima TaxID=2940935 RepID=A0ABT5WIQ5_9GAMM|nr:response regulator receiver domain [Marinomonas maritima]MDE8604547.1 response regulator receiver domain [Marinomonas maritima]